MMVAEGMNTYTPKGNNPMAKTTPVRTDFGKRPVTSTDVARLANVSQATVSRAFNKSARLAPETRERVLEAARQLGYRPNAIARSLVSNKTNLIGLIVMRNGSPFYNELVNRMVLACRQFGYCCMMIRQIEGERGVDTVARALEYRVDGVIVTAIEDTKSACDLCRQASVPIVLLNRFLDGADVDSVCCNNALAGELIIEFLASKGHKTLGCLMGDPTASTTRERMRGLQRKAAECDMKIISTLYGDYTYESGRQMCRTMMKTNQPLPDTIFCSGDIIAFGVMDSLRQEFGLRVPEDVSIIGFDDTSEASWLSYNLTTVRQPYDKLVHTACELLLRRMEQPKAELLQVLHDCTFVERGSVSTK